MSSAEFDTNLRFSANAFRKLVWPEIAHLCGGGSLRSIEGSGAHEDLDIVGGVDCFQLFTNGMRTIAQRTERWKAHKRYAFTIRSEVASGQPTELQKRIAAIETGMDLPMLTVHGFVDERGFVKAGITLTREFYAWLLANRSSRFIQERSNGTDGNKMLLIEWSDMIRKPEVPLITTDGILVTRGPRDWPWPPEWPDGIKRGAIGRLI